MTVRQIEIPSILDGNPLGPFRRRVMLICWLIAVLDGVDVQSMAFVSPVLAGQWNIAHAQMGQILTAGLVGLMLGSLLAGQIGDRIGRRPALLGSVIVVGAGSLLTALSDTVLHLMLTRCLTGVGLGAAIVSATTLTLEYAPRHSRAFWVTAMLVGFPLGGSIGGVAATPLMSAFGWQSVFIVGGVVPLLLIACVWQLLPESLQFRVAARRDPRQTGAILSRIDARYEYQPGDQFALGEISVQRSAMRELFAQGRLPGTLLIWLVCFLNLLVLYLLINWLPSMLHGSGMTLARANMGAVVFNIGGIIGALALAFIVDRVGALRVLPVSYAVTALIVLAIARVNDPGLALLLTALGGAGIGGSQFCFNALVAGYYPAAVRTTGLGWALGLGRVGSILGPLIGGLAMARGATMTDIFSGAALPILACSLAVTAMWVVSPSALRRDDSRTDDIVARNPRHSEKR